MAIVENEIKIAVEVVAETRIVVEVGRGIEGVGVETETVGAVAMIEVTRIVGVAVVIEIVGGTGAQGNPGIPTGGIVVEVEAGTEICLHL